MGNLRRWPWLTAIGMSVAVAFGLFGASNAMAAKPAKINWAVSEVLLEGYPGYEVRNVHFFEVTEPVAEVTFSLTPSLQDVARVETPMLHALEPGIQYSVQVVVTLPEEWTDRTTRGVIRGRDEAGVIANPAPAVIRTLSEPPITDLPRSEAEAILSKRQVVLDPTLGTYFNPAADDSTFNGQSASTYFRLDEGLINPDINMSAVFQNGILLDRTWQTITENYLRVSSFGPGRKEFSVEIPDSDGQIAAGNFIVWFGDQTTQFRVTDRYGRELLEQFEVTVRPINGDVVSITEFGFGGATFRGLPYNVPLLITAKEVLGSRVASTVFTDKCRYCSDRAFLRVLEPGAPSHIDNNDFSLGTSGWITTHARSLSLLEHGELPPGFESEEALWTTMFFGGSREDMDARLESSTEATTSDPVIQTMASGNTDLAIRTDGIGLQYVARNFATEPGTRAVRVRYRFASFEVANGYYGTEFNDFFAVSAANSSGRTVSDSRSMNDLGYDFFSPNGVGPWMDMTLPVNEEDGDVVLVEVGVANVSDPFLHSYLIVDLIDETEIEISDLAFDDSPVYRRKPGPMRYFSFDAHPYAESGGGRFADADGNPATEVHGTFRINGPEDVAIESVVLEVLRAGELISEVNLRAEHEDSILRAFGPDQVIEVSESARLFDVPVTENLTGAPERAQLRLRVQANNGDTVTKQYEVLPILVRHDVAKENRYFCCNATAVEPDGGDEWIRPELRWLPRHLAENHDTKNLVVGDTSNMNGGVFYPHITHRDGRDTDIDFTGYDSLDSGAADVLIGILNDDLLRPHIAQMLIWCGERKVEEDVDPPYDPNSPNELCEILSTVTLNNGERASKYVTHKRGHWGHVHITWK